jgi:hypothetical protein
MSRDAHCALRRIGQARAAAMDGIGCALHRFGIRQQAFAGLGQHIAVGQSIEQPCADRIL